MRPERGACALQRVDAEDALAKLPHVGGDSRYELPDLASAIKNTYSFDSEFEAELSRRIGGRYPREWVGWQMSVIFAGSARAARAAKEPL